MKRTLIIKPEVYSEADRVAYEYEKLTPGTGRRFDLSVVRLFEKIEFMPMMFGKRSRSVRIAPIRKFPFALLYVVTKRTVEIFALIPARSNPTNWPTKP